MRMCNTPGCSTLWLDPMPAEAEIINLYATYFTHLTSSNSKPHNRWRCIFEGARTAYLRAQFGYVSKTCHWFDRLLGMAIHLDPALKAVVEASVFHLRANPGGRLLEIGCGSGDSLDFLQRIGWCVTGLDFDEGAVQNAAKKGLDVRLGKVTDQTFANESFDAIVMSHVIEHIPSPGKLLEDCRGLLKRAGVFVARTPNANSLLHFRNGRNWRGLDAPRHLQIFSVESLADLAKRAGYRKVETHSSMNGFVYHDLASRELAKGIKHVMGGPVALRRRIVSHIKAFIYGWWWGGQNGEELTLVCRK
jgi:2-polyprenyl-3-methyl-5-hydroxy-6-metoxy-1,4-benzoquinol methylase